MEKSIFRKKSLERIQSPENLNDYIRVSNPGVWLILAAVIVLLAGACIWGFFGHIDSAVPVDVHVQDDTAVGYIAAADSEKIEIGMTVEFGDAQGTVTGFLPEQEGFCCVTVEAELPDGIYAAKVICERIRPLSFVFN